MAGDATGAPGFSRHGRSSPVTAWNAEVRPRRSALGREALAAHAVVRTTSHGISPATRPVPKTSSRTPTRGRSKEPHASTDQRAVGGREMVPTGPHDDAPAVPVAVRIGVPVLPLSES